LDLSGTIPAESWAEGLASFRTARLQLAPLEVFPQRRPQPFGPRGIALPVAGLAALLTLLAARHGLSIRRPFTAGKARPNGSTSGR
jgi:hypothetical protein